MYILCPHRIGPLCTILSHYDWSTRSNSVHTNTERSSEVMMELFIEKLLPSVSNSAEKQY